MLSTLRGVKTKIFYHEKNSSLTFLTDLLTDHDILLQISAYLMRIYKEKKINGCLPSYTFKIYIFSQFYIVCTNAAQNCTFFTQNLSISVLLSWLYITKIVTNSEISNKLAETM